MKCSKIFRKKIDTLLFISLMTLLLLIHHRISNDTSFQNNNQIDSRPSKKVPPIDEIIQQQREVLLNEMEFFGYSKDNLTNLTLETNGKPLRRLLVSTYRSGAKFLVGAIRSIPGIYYHHEPLMALRKTVIRGPPYDKPALSIMKNLFNCNYSGAGMEKYANYGRSHESLLGNNDVYSKLCGKYSNYCNNYELLEPLCKLFPFQLMRIARLSLDIVGKLLEDDNLNIKILLLVRDPRGLYNSRKRQVWCKVDRDCDEPEIYCKYLEEDYQAAVKLAKFYPKRFKAVRYEDLCLNPHGMLQEILTFYGLEYSTRVEDYLNLRTRVNRGGEFSTFRVSSNTPFLWMKSLSETEVNNVQLTCFKVLGDWRYKLIMKYDYKGNPNTLLSFTKFKGV